MGTLSEQLLKAGLVSPEKRAEHAAQELARDEAEQQKRQSRLTAKSRKPANFDRLENATSVNGFKRVALGILQEHPNAIGDVITFAHHLQDKPGGKKLVWLMYQVQDGLAKLPAKDHQRFLKRALRKAGGSLELPKS